MQIISINDLTHSEVIDLVNYSNDMIGNTGCYPDEYIVYRGDDHEHKLENLEAIMQEMGYPELAVKMGV